MQFEKGRFGITKPVFIEHNSASKPPDKQLQILEDLVMNYNGADINQKNSKIITTFFT
jgi:hypothetical protein